MNYQERKYRLIVQVEARDESIIRGEGLIPLLEEMDIEDLEQIVSVGRNKFLIIASHHLTQYDGKVLQTRTGFTLRSWTMKQIKMITEDHLMDNEAEEDDPFEGFDNDDVADTEEFAANVQSALDNQCLSEDSNPEVSDDNEWRVIQRVNTSAQKGH